jgi:hypothetical protein
MFITMASRYTTSSIVLRCYHTNPCDANYEFMHSFQSSPSKENHFARVNYFQRCAIYIEETQCQVSFIFPFPFLSPLEHALFIQAQFKCIRAEVRSFDGDQGLILIGDVFFFILWWTPRECKLARTQKDRDRSVAVRTFYNSSWRIHRGSKQNSARTFRTKDDDVFRANHKIVRP